MKFIIISYQFIIAVFQSEYYNIYLNTFRHVAATSIQVFLVIFVLFWCSIILKVFYNDFYNTRSKSSTLCNAAEVIDEWLSLGLSKAAQCNDNSDSFFERLYQEAESFVNFVIAQFRFIPIIWLSLQEIILNAKDDLGEYCKTIWIDIVKRYHDFRL